MKTVYPSLKDFHIWLQVTESMKWNNGQWFDTGNNPLSEDQLNKLRQQHKVFVSSLLNYR